MKRIQMFVLAVFAVSLAACASGPAESDFGGAVGRGDAVYAHSIEETSPDDWSDDPPYPALAELVPGIIEDGVEAVEFQLGYGETSIAWVFDGFEPGAMVDVAYDLNLDFFGTETYFRTAILSGTFTAEDAIDPRDEVNAGVVHRWADITPGVPDTTGGWVTMEHRLAAGDDGAVSVIFIMGRAVDDPPVVFGHFTNPIAEVM